MHSSKSGGASVGKRCSGCIRKTLNTGRQQGFQGDSISRGHGRQSFFKRKPRSKIETELVTEKKLQLVRVLPLRAYLNVRVVAESEIVVVSHAESEDEDRLVYIYRKAA